MRTRAKGTSRAAVLAAGFVALGVTAIPSNAFADVTGGHGGVLSGNQIDAPISAPVDVSGNGGALLGTGTALSRGGAKAHSSGAGGHRTSGRHGVASGNQVSAPISVPVTVCGNAVGVLGRADAGCADGAEVSGGGGGGQVTDGTHGVLSGNQANGPIGVPVTACGNAAALVGDTWAFCEGGARVHGNSGGDQQTSGVHGVLSGNQGNTPISIPVELCGDAAAVAGQSAASCNGRTFVEGSHGSGYGGYSRTDSTLPSPPTATFPTLPKVATDLPVHGLTQGLGTRTDDGYRTANAAPITGVRGTNALPRMSDVAQLAGLPKLLALPSTSNQRTRNIPPVGDGVLAKNARPKVGDMVRTDDRRARGGSLGADGVVGGKALPKVDGVSSLNNVAQVAGLPKLLALPSTSNQRTRNVLPSTRGLVAENALPRVAGLSKVAVPSVSNRRVQGGLPVAGGVLGKSALLKVGDVARTAGGQKVAGPSMSERHAHPGLPAADGLVGKNALPKGEQGGLTDGGPSSVRGAGQGVVPAAGETGGAVRSVVPVTGEIGPVRNVAAAEAVADEDGSLWAFAASGALGVVAGVLALARRVRLGGRR